MGWASRLLARAFLLVPVAAYQPGAGATGVSIVGELVGLPGNALTIQLRIDGLPLEPVAPGSALGQFSLTGEVRYSGGSLAFVDGRQGGLASEPPATFPLFSSLPPVDVAGGKLIALSALAWFAMDGAPTGGALFDLDFELGTVPGELWFVVTELNGDSAPGLEARASVGLVPLPAGLWGLGGALALMGLAVRGRSGEVQT